MVASVNTATRYTLTTQVITRPRDIRVGVYPELMGGFVTWVSARVKTIFHNSVKYFKERSGPPRLKRLYLRHA